MYDVITDSGIFVSDMPTYAIADSIAGSLREEFDSTARVEQN